MHIAGRMSRRRSTYVWYVAAIGAIAGIAWATAHGSENPTLSAQGSATSCVQCHNFEQTQSHPVNAFPSMATPSSLPLDNGKVSCVTCHDAGATHVSASELVGIRGGNAAGLCVQCHAAASPGSVGIHA